VTEGLNYKMEVMTVLRKTPSPVPIRRLLKVLGLMKTTRALNVALRDLEAKSVITREGRSRDMIWLLRSE